MIFVTVGAQMPFDRLIRSVDDWAADHHRRDVFAQIGRDGWKPRYIHSRRFLAPDQFDRCVEDADVIIAHAGMGSIIKALELGKPILVMPRRGAFLETRNDHQLATAARLSELGLVDVAMNEDQLRERLDALNELHPHRRITDHADDDLIHTLRDFALGEPVGV